MASPSEAPLPVPAQPTGPGAVLGFSLVAVSAALVALHFSPFFPERDALDEQVVAYVWDTLVPPWAAMVVDECRLPSRAIDGVLRVKSDSGRISLDGWRWRKAPTGWTEQHRACFERFLIGRWSTAPASRVELRQRREYDLDVAFTIPPSAGLQ